MPTRRKFLTGLASLIALPMVPIRALAGRKDVVAEPSVINVPCSDCTWEVAFPHGATVTFTRTGTCDGTYEWNQG